MRSIVVSVLVFLVIVALDGCFTAPTYPVVPQIAFINLAYEKVPSPDLDALVLDISFKDGDGDLGLDPSIAKGDTTYALTLPDLFYQGNLVTYKLKRTNPNLFLPDGSTLGKYNFAPPYSCTNWIVKDTLINNVVKRDTFFVRYNPSYYNIFIDFQIDDGTGNFVKFDPTTYFQYPGCSTGGFNGRFPILASDPGKKSPLDGKLNYRMKSSALDIVFGVRQFKIDITIQDRAYHKSNKISAGPFTLPSIRR